MLQGGLQNGSPTLSVETKREVLLFIYYFYAMKKIKLTNLEARNLSNQEMSSVIGGNVCNCACYHRNTGDSSIQDNGTANWAGGLNSTHDTADSALMVDDGEGGCYDFWYGPN